MRVGRADHAELVGVDAELCLQLETVFQGRPRIFELKHFGRLGHRQVEVALVPAFEIGELVVRRQEGMGLAIALDLRRLVEPLPFGPLLSILAVDRLAGERIHHREHDAVREVAVVGEGEHVAAGLFLKCCHVFPQVARIVASREHREGHHLAGELRVVTEDDVAVEIVAAGVRGPFETDEGGEAAGFVRVLRSVDGFLPGRAIGRRVGCIEDRSLELTRAERSDDLHRCLGPLSRLHHVIPAATQWVGQELWLPGEQVREEAHVVGVVGDDQEIERPRQLGELTGGRHDLLALGEAVGVARGEARAESPGIHRERRMRMCVAEERPGREVAPGPGRVGPLVGIEPVGRGLVEGADVGDDALLCRCR